MKLISVFRKIALIEGISFLLILFVTMPLKYIWNIPEPTYFVGMVHGVLFVIYVVLAFWVYAAARLKLITLFWILLASIIPFGTFVVDEKILKKLIPN